MEENKDLGKVRPEHVKRLARQLAEQFPDRFTTDFEKNKELVDTLTDISSTKFRNRVAGYMIHLVRERIARESSEVNVKDAS
jgi:small subunit ribosomal protein S17e